MIDDPQAPQPFVAPTRQQLADALKQMGVNPSDFMGGGLMPHFPSGASYPDPNQAPQQAGFQGQMPTGFSPMAMAARGGSSMQGPLQRLGGSFGQGIR